MCRQRQNRPLARSAVNEADALRFISGAHRVGLGVEQAGQDDAAAGGERGGKARRELDQRSGQYVGDDQVERRARGEHWRVRAVRDREQDFAGAVAELDPVDRRIVARDVDRLGVDVGGDAARLRPQRQRGEGEQAGAGADVGDIGEALTIALELVERFEAARGGRMLAGAEGEAGVDLER